MKYFLQRLAVAVLVLGLNAPGQIKLTSTADLPYAPDPQTGSGDPPQQSSSAPPQSTTDPAPNAAQVQKKPAQKSGDQVKAAEKQRMLGIVPEFNTVNGQDALPLTKGQKLDLWWKSSIDPFTFAIAGVDAGIEQAENSYPGYHQGASGYAKRYGAAYADGVDGNLWGNAILPILLRQDPRYFRLGQGTFKQRLWYATLSTVRTRGDNGKWQPNYSNVGGNLIGGAISNIYYPASDRGVGLIFERGFTVTAEGALGSLAYEFYPDVIGHYKRVHQERLAAKAGAAPAPVAPQTP